MLEREQQEACLSIAPDALAESAELAEQVQRERIGWTGLGHCRGFCREERRLAARRATEQS